MPTAAEALHIHHVPVSIRVSMLGKKKTYNWGRGTNEYANVKKLFLLVSFIPHPFGFEHSLQIQIKNQ